MHLTQLESILWKEWQLENVPRMPRRWEENKNVLGKENLFRSPRWERVGRAFHAVNC